MSRGFDWPALMRAGLQGLKLRPAEFWALTPAELQMLLGTPGARQPLLRGGLEALMAAYPDKTKDESDG
ncbi:MAG: rcc01693 family protein [Pseudomonadota bacterium]